MAVSIYKANQFRILAGKKIYQSSAWKSLPDNARIYLNGTWHYLSGRAATAYLVSATDNGFAALMPVDQAAMGDLSASGNTFYFVHDGNLYPYSYGEVSSPVLTNVTSVIDDTAVSGGEVYNLYDLSVDSRYGSGWTAFDSLGCCGIKNGDLYDSAGNLMLSNVSIWQLGEYQSLYTVYSYAIKNGLLYFYFLSPTSQNSSLYEANVGLASTSTLWTAISRWRSRNDAFTCGICGGVLNRLYRSTATAIDSSGTWTAVDGQFYANTSYSTCRGVRDGQLCRVDNVGNVTVMDSRTGWTLYSEVFAICEGKLYNISGNTPVQIGSWSDWIDVHVTKNTYSNNFAVALRRTAV